MVAESSEKEKTNRTWTIFGRTWCSILVLAILAVVFFNVFNADPKGKISEEVLFLFFLVSVIVLSEQFDNFAIGSLFSLSKAHNKTIKELKDSKKESEDLKQNLITLAMNVSQKQSNVTNVRVESDMMVRKAPSEAVSEKYSDWAAEEDSNKPTLRGIDVSLNKMKVRGDDIESEETSILEAYLGKQGISKSILVREALISSSGEDASSLVSNPPIFDGYVNTGEKELFFELKLTRPHIRTLVAKINLMLMIVQNYRNAKSVNAQLILLLKSASPSDLKKLQEALEPAIAKGLLRIELVE